MRIPKLASAGKGFWEAVRNIGWISAGRVIRMGGSLVVGTMVVRYLGPTQYGIFSYAFAVFGVFNIVSNLGLDVLVVSEIATTEDAEGEAHVLGTAFILKVLASIVTTIAATAYAWFTHPDDVITTVIVAMLSVASIAQGFDVVDFFFQAKTRSRLVVIPQVCVFVMSNSARVIAVFYKAPLLVFGIISSLEILFTELGLAVMYFRDQGSLLRWKFHMEKGVALLRSSWPLLISGLLIIVYMRTDQIILGNLKTKAMVGEYASASKLSEIWYSIPTLICTSVMPKLLRSKMLSPERYYYRLQRLYDLMIGVSVVLALLVTFLGKYMILLMFGRAYLPAAKILSVHIWTGPFVFIGVVSGIQLVHENLTKISLQRSIIGALTNVALNYALIPRFGGVGSAAATLTTQIISSYVLDAFNKSTRHIFLMKTRAITGKWIFTMLRQKPELATT